MPFPTTPILDSGVGGDEAPLAGNWAGPTYTGEDQLRRISNQIAANTGVASFGDSYWNASQFQANQEARLTVAAFPNVGEMLQIEVRLSPLLGAPNGYTLRFIPDAGTDILRLRKITAGSTSALGADILQEVAIGDSLGIQCIDDSIMCWYQPAAGAWTLLATRTDSTFIQVGNLGVSMQTPGGPTRITNFGGGNVSLSQASDNPPIGFLGRGAGW